MSLKYHMAIFLYFGYNEIAKLESLSPEFNQ